MLSLYVDQGAWLSHLHRVAEANSGLVPVVKGNGYGLGLERLCRVAAELPRVDTIAVGDYAEAARALDLFGGSVLVLTPWRPFDPRTLRHPRVVHTVGREADLLALTDQCRRGDPHGPGDLDGQGDVEGPGEVDEVGGPGKRETTQQERPRVVLEVLTSMRRHGFTPRELREAAGGLARDPDAVGVEGFALHLPIAGGSPVAETQRLLTDIVASGIEARRVYVSHLQGEELHRVRANYGDFEIRPRIGTALWLGDRSLLRARATVLDVHAVERGDIFGYRGRSAPKAGHILVVSGGTANGIGLEAPGAGATIRDRAARVAKGGLDAAGFVRSPFTVGGKQRLFAEAPHMQVSMLFLPSGAPVPGVGEEISVQVRFTTTSFDQVVTV